MNDAIIEWEEKYVLGIPVIDEQHKKLVGLTNTLYESCLEGEETANETFVLTARELVEYVRYHFSFEEKMLLRFKYPDFVTHKNEHDDFTRRILQSASDYKEGKRFVPNNFVRFLRDWILTHIAYTDKRYVPFITAALRKEPV